MKIVLSVLSISLALGGLASAQEPAPGDALLKEGTLRTCVSYALLHQPSVQQSLLDEQITDRIIGGKLADWFPQINFSVSAQHYYQVPVSVVGGSPVNVSLANASTGSLSVTQALFNRDVLLAATTAGNVREQSRKRTAGNAIDVVVSVSKAFYASLLTREEIKVLDDDILRLEQSLKDAYNQYQGGIVDKTDYERATVALNNAKAQRAENVELLAARDAALKSAMGYPPRAPLEIVTDSTLTEPDITVDTTHPVVYGNRVEYQLLEVEERLAEANLDYQRWSFLPSLSAFGSYNLNYQNEQIPPLYRHLYPSSYVGLQLSLPVFVGGKRVQEIRQASLELRRLQYDIEAFRNAADAGYAQALAEYKGNLNTYNVLKTNVQLAEDVYRTIQLQYRAGTKTYLEVISAETDLRTAQVSRTDALYRVLSSKLDVQRALGNIPY